MTDLEKFIDTYKQFGIDIKFDEKDGIKIITLGGCWEDSDTHSDKFIGYSGFYSQLEFDKNGKFLNQGFWE